MKLFTKHPNSIGETYFEHLIGAFTVGLKMIFGGLACLIHGIFPFICVKTGSTTIKDLHEHICAHRTADEKHSDKS